MGQSKTISRYVTVEGTTYPPGTKLSDMEDGHADAIADNAKVFEDVDTVEGEENLTGNGYDDASVWTIDRLKSEIDTRNGDGRTDDQKIAKAGKRDELVARLVADDTNVPA